MREWHASPDGLDGSALIPFRPPSRELVDRGRPLGSLCRHGLLLSNLPAKRGARDIVPLDRLCTPFAPHASLKASNANNPCSSAPAHCSGTRRKLVLLHALGMAHARRAAARRNPSAMQDARSARLGAARRPASPRQIGTFDAWKPPGSGRPTRRPGRVMFFGIVKPRGPQWQSTSSNTSGWTATRPSPICAARRRSRSSQASRRWTSFRSGASTAARPCRPKATAPIAC